MVTLRQGKPLFSWPDRDAMIERLLTGLVASR